MNEEKKLNSTAMAYLLSCAQASPRLQEIFAFSESKGLEEKEILLENGESYPLADYAMHIFCNGCSILKQIVPDMAAASESLFVVSVLLPLVEASSSNWNYGSELLFELNCGGYNLSRQEIIAILAQQGNFASNRSKGSQLEGNPLSVSLYCGRLIARLNTLPELKKPLGGELSALSVSHICCDSEASYQERVEALVRTYVPKAYFAPKEKEIEAFLGFLANSDFYTAPASTRFHLSCEAGLVQHELHVVDRLVQLACPSSEAQVATCVLAAIGHDLCKIGVYAPYLKNQKVYHENGSKSDSQGAYDWQEVVGYNFSDSFPIGHGLKSMHLITRFFPSNFPKEVACAIDAHMCEENINPRCYQQMMEYPLALWLHIADMIASQIDEV